MRLHRNVECLREVIVLHISPETVSFTTQFTTLDGVYDPARPWKQGAGSPPSGHHPDPGGGSDRYR